MPGYVIGNFFIYALINAITPGPGNILALNTVSNYGWKKGKPLFFGIFIGYYIVQIICAIFVYGVSAFLPNVLGIMKYIGAAYILILAIHIAISKPKIDNSQKSTSFLKGFFLQFVNVKIYLFGITAFPGFVIEYYKSFVELLVFELIIATIGSIARLGILLKKIYLKYYLPINIILALLLLECIYSMLK